MYLYYLLSHFILVRQLTVIVSDITCTTGCKMCLCPRTTIKQYCQQFCKGQGTNDTNINQDNVSVFLLVH